MAVRADSPASTTALLHPMQATHAQHNFESAMKQTSNKSQTGKKFRTRNVVCHVQTTNMIETK
jgi:hypothetical protein